MRQPFSSCVVILIYNKRVMELTCALLHPDARMVEKLQEWMKEMPFLRLCGCYTDTLEALRAYCVSRVDVYVVGIVPVSAGEVGGMDFCRMLSPHTRVIFIADREGYAAECFRLDALDYLVEKDLRFATFFQAVNKAMRWFACHKPGDALPQDTLEKAALPEKIIYLRSDSRILRLELDSLDYVESCGDYVKIYCRDEGRPFLILCTMKYMEEKLPSASFVRIHRSYIVRLGALSAIGSNEVYIGDKELPIGNAYRERLKPFLSALPLL